MELPLLLLVLCLLPLLGLSLSVSRQDPEESFTINNPGTNVEGGSSGRNHPAASEGESQTSYYESQSESVLTKASTDKADPMRRSDEARYHSTVVPSITESGEYHRQLRPTESQKEAARTLPLSGDLRRSTVHPEPVLPPRNKSLPFTLPKNTTSTSPAPDGEGTSEREGAVRKKEEGTTDFGDLGHSLGVEKVPSNNASSPTAPTAEAVVADPATEAVSTVYELRHSYPQITTEHTVTGTHWIIGVIGADIDGFNSNVTRDTEKMTPSASTNTATDETRGPTAVPNRDVEISVASTEKTEVGQNSTTAAKSRIALNGTAEVSSVTSDSNTARASTTENSTVSRTVMSVDATLQPRELEQQGYSETLTEEKHVTTLTPDEDHRATAPPLVEAALLTPSTGTVAMETVTAVIETVRNRAAKPVEATVRESNVGRSPVSLTESTAVLTHPRGTRTETATRDDVTSALPLEAVSTSTSTSQNRTDSTVDMLSTTRPTESTSETRVQSNGTDSDLRTGKHLGESTAKVHAVLPTEDAITFAGVGRTTEMAASYVDVTSTSSTIEVSTVEEESSLLRVSAGMPGAQTVKSYFSASEVSGIQEVVTESSLARQGVTTVPTHDVVDTAVAGETATAETSATTVAVTPSPPSDKGNTFPLSNEEIVSTLPAEGGVNSANHPQKTDSHTTLPPDSTVAAISLDPLPQGEENSSLPSVISTETFNSVPSSEPTRPFELATVRVDENTTSSSALEEQVMLQTLMPEVSQANKGMTFVLPTTEMPDETLPPEMLTEQADKNTSHSLRHPPTFPSVDEELSANAELAENATMLLNTPTTVQPDADTTVLTVMSSVPRIENTTLPLPVSTPSVAQPNYTTQPLSSPASTPPHENTMPTVPSVASTTTKVLKSSVNLDKNSIALLSTTTVTEVEQWTSQLPVTTLTVTGLGENSTLSSSTVVNATLPTPPSTSITARIDESSTPVPIVTTPTVTHFDSTLSSTAVDTTPTPPPTYAVVRVNKSSTPVLTVTTPTVMQLAENSTLFFPKTVNETFTTPPMYTTARLDKNLTPVQTSTTLNVTQFSENSTQSSLTIHRTLSTPPLMHTTSQADKSTTPMPTVTARNVTQVLGNSTLSSPTVNATLPTLPPTYTAVLVNKSLTPMPAVTTPAVILTRGYTSFSLATENVTLVAPPPTYTTTEINKTSLPPITTPITTQLSKNPALSPQTTVYTILTTPPPTTYIIDKVVESLTSVPSVLTSATTHPDENSPSPTSKTTRPNQETVLRGPPQLPVATSDCVPLEPPKSPSHEFQLVFETSTDFSWEQVEVLERRIQSFLNDTPCSKNFARTAFALGPPHVLSWTNPSVNSTWCDRDAVDTIFRSMTDPSTAVPSDEVTGAFLPEFHIISVQLQLRGACLPGHDSSLPALAGAAAGIVLATVLLAGLLTLLWKMLRTTRRKMDVTPPAPEDSFDLKQRRPMLLPGEGRAPATAGTPHKSPRAKPNPPFVVDTDFCYINPNFLEAVKPSPPPPPPPYRRPLDRRVRSLEAVLPAKPPHATLGNRSLGGEVTAEQDELNCTSSSSGVESDVQHSGEGGK